MSSFFLTYVAMPGLMSAAFAIMVWFGDRPRSQRIWLAPICFVMMLSLFYLAALSQPSGPLPKPFVPHPHYIMHLEVLP